VRLKKLCALLLVLAWPAAARAQCPGCDDDDAPRTGGEVVTLGVNALLGGVTAGVRAWARGGSPQAGFVRGAAGGALVYAGKRIAAEPFDGAGALGRPLAAVGSSVVYNAGAGRGMLSRVMLPVGPLHVYLEPRGSSPVRVKLDAAATVAAAYAATRPGARFRAGESLASSAIVFRRTGPATGQLRGEQAGGVMTVVYPSTSGEIDTLQVDRIAAHERVHTVQYDQGFLLWAAPAEEWIAGRSPAVRAIHRYVDFGVNVAAQFAVGAAIPYDARPWEREAYFLSRTRATP
jgi:hypothetical protein